MHLLFKETDTLPRGGVIVLDSIRVQEELKRISFIYL